MIQIKYKEGLSRNFKNIKSIAKGTHNLAATLDLLTINGTESGALELSKRQYTQILAEVQQAIMNLEFTEEHLKKYLKQ